MSERGGPLAELAEQLRDEDTPISSHVVDSAKSFTDLSADYGYVIEAVREGYLLHYGDPRLLSGHDSDLALLAGDYLYALGIEKLAEMGDTDAVLLLANLISTSAQLHSEGCEAELPNHWREAQQTLREGMSPTGNATIRSGIP